MFSGVWTAGETTGMALGATVLSIVLALTGYIESTAGAQAAAQEPLLDVVLRPGDCLYLPRGYLHSATALGGVSGHLTIGVHAWTRYAVLERVLADLQAELAQDESWRASLPLGVDFGRERR